MELVHADSYRNELGFISDFEEWDCVSSLKPEKSANDFSLTVPKKIWQADNIKVGHYLYELGTEWGGRVEGIEHSPPNIILTGATWRGMLNKKIVKPYTGLDYLTVTNKEANLFISDLIGNNFGTLIAASTNDSGILVSGEFRYSNLLDAVQVTLARSKARLDVSFDNGVVTLSGVPRANLSSYIQISQDYGFTIRSSYKKNQAYNHIIALGSGELSARQVIELYRDQNGDISADALPVGVDDYQVVYDYGNAESLEDLITKATEQLASYAPVEKVEIDLGENQGLFLGDIVSGKDDVTGMEIVTFISEIVRTVRPNGSKITYKVGV